MWYFFLLKGTEKDCPYGHMPTFQSLKSKKCNKSLNSFFGYLGADIHRCRVPKVCNQWLVYVGVENFNKCGCGTPEDCACQVLDITAACS